MYPVGQTYLDPPFGYQISARKRSVCFWVGFLGHKFHTRLEDSGKTPTKLKLTLLMTSSGRWRDSMYLVSVSCIHHLVDCGDVSYVSLSVSLVKDIWYYIYCIYVCVCFNITASLVGICFSKPQISTNLQGHSSSSSKSASMSLKKWGTRQKSWRFTYLSMQKKKTSHSTG